eukprot:898839-Alexandrium_andersonii.AAC.1
MAAFFLRLASATRCAAFAAVLFSWFTCERAERPRPRRSKCVSTAPAHRHPKPYVPQRAIQD